MEKLKGELLEMQRERDWKQFHTPENLAKSISIEAAELLECFQWNNSYNLNEVCEELADIVNYCILMGDALGVNIEDVALEKNKKTKNKYPIDKAKGNSTKYTKL